MYLALYCKDTRVETLSSIPQIVVGHDQAHKPAVTYRISGWLVKMMAVAGINVQQFKAHSTRVASVSKAKAKGLSVTEIMKMANWKHASMFRFYDGTKASPAFAQAVLMRYNLSFNMYY